MTSELGVWTADDCAIVLIDYQNEMFEVIRSETNADLVELHARLLARVGKAFGMPVVISSVGVNFGFNGPTIPSILADLDGMEPIDRLFEHALIIQEVHSSELVGPACMRKPRANPAQTVRDKRTIRACGR